MRKTILFIAASIDGFIARENGDVDWLNPDESFDFAPFVNSVDTVLMGYNTYKKSLLFGEEAFLKDKQYFVFSRQSRQSQDDRVTFINTDPSQFVKQLKNNPGKHIWLMGGGELNTSFLNAHLIDEIQLFFVPVLLGSGIPLFASGYTQTDLQLTHQQFYDSGLVELHYKLK
jgi:dihydrofolate reductase